MAWRRGAESARRLCRARQGRIARRWSNSWSRSDAEAACSRWSLPLRGLRRRRPRPRTPVISRRDRRLRQAGLWPVPCASRRQLATRWTTLCARPVAGQARSRAKHVPDPRRRVVRGRDHPLRTGDGGEPAGAHPVLAGSQEHRPQAGAGGACRQGRDGHRSGDAAGQERRHAGARRARIRAVRHRLGGACRAGRSLSLRLWRGDRRQCRGRWPAMSTPPGRIRRALHGNGRIRAPSNPLYRTDARGDDRAVQRLRPRPGDGARRAPQRLPRRDRARRQAEAGDLLALGRHGRLDRGQSRGHEDAVRRIRPRRAAARRFAAGSPSRSASSSTMRSACSTRSRRDRSSKSLHDEKKRQALAITRLITSHLSELFGIRLAAELGLTAGFSSLDGD